MMSTPAATRVESVREKRAIVTLRTTSPIFIGILSLIRSQSWRPASVLLEAADAPDRCRTNAGKMMYQWCAQLVGGRDDPLRQRRQLAVQLGEDLHEDRHEEHQQADQDEGGEDQHHRRVHHRALDAALDLRLLLDLERDAVEHGVQDSGGLAGLDHRDVEAAEDLRVAASACESSSPPSTSARISLITSAKYGSSVCSSRITSELTTFRPASIIVANWREKICSVFGLIFLKTVRTPSSPLAGQLLEELGQQAADPQLLARGVEIGSVDLAARARGPPH